MIAERLFLTVFPLVEAARRGAAGGSKRAEGGRISDRDSDNREGDTTFPSCVPPLSAGQLEGVVGEMLVHLGHLWLDCPPNQCFASTGPPPTLLVRLCTFPIMYFSDDR